jgi:hypothetical protein
MEWAPIVGTAVGTGIFTIWHKAFAEFFAPVITFLQKEKIDSVKEKIEELKPFREEEVFSVAPPVKDYGDYMDSGWSDGSTPGRAFEKMEAVLDTSMSEETARKVTNTCKKLLKVYAMESYRKKQFERIRDALLVDHPSMAREIDMDLFSQCALWEGKIALYR